MTNYLNNAGAGLMTDITYGAIVKHLDSERRLGASGAAQEAKPQVAAFYSHAAGLVNASEPEEIAFMDSASRGWNFMVSGVPLATGARIVTLSTEFGTNLITLYNRAKEVNGELRVLKCDTLGLFSLDELRKELNRGVGLIAISHAIAHGSVINPVEEVGRLAKEYGVPYIVDGCQAVGQLLVDVRSIRCDAYNTTGRKWLSGPRGTGFVYVQTGSSIRATQLDLASADLLLDPQMNIVGLEIVSTARRFELWERSVANVLGLSAAMEQALSFPKPVESDNLRVMANRLRQVVNANEGLRLIGQLESFSGVVGFYTAEVGLEQKLKERLSNMGIVYSGMSTWDCPLDFPRNGATTIFRLSPGYATSQATIDAAVEALTQS